MGDGQVVQVAVAGLASRVKNERHVHHDVDEQALGATNERRYCPLRLNRSASVRPAVISTWRSRSSPVKRYQGR